jgi:hypothetical protein
VTRGPLPRRSGMQVRRLPVRRSTPRLRSVQIVAAFLMAACLVGIVAISVAPSFAARTLEIHGATFTSQSVIRTIVGMDGTPNVFRIETDRAADKLARLPAVKSASVEIRLPSTVIVTLVERDPKLVWVIGGVRYVADQDGLLFGSVDSAGNPVASSAGPLASPTEVSLSSPSPSPSTSSSGETPVESSGPTSSPSPSPKPSPTKAAAKATPTKAGAKATPARSASPSVAPPALPSDASLLPSLAPAPSADPAAVSGPAALALPVVFDRRASDIGLGLGGVVDPTNLDAGYRLAGLTPTDVDSKGTALAVVLDDDHGFTVSCVPIGWVAEFGFYAPTVRKTTVVPTQVRDLRSALDSWGETKVAWVYLVSDVSSNHSDTVVLR